MKILLLNDYATPTAGAELLTVWLRDAFRRAGHEARVLASRAQLIPGQDFANRNVYGTTGWLQAYSAMANPSATRALRQELGDFRPDVVHLNMFMWQLSPSVLAPLRDVPCLYYAGTYRTVCLTGSRRLPNGSTCRNRAGVACLREGCLTPDVWVPRMLQHALWVRRRGSVGRVIAVSDTVRTRLHEGGVRVDDVVWPGVPEWPSGRGPGDRPVLTYTGRLVNEKGVDILLRAFAHVLHNGQPDAMLLIAGTGPAQSALQALAERLGVADAVSWLGQLAHRELADRLAGAWAHAMPSTWAEPFGLSGMDAMMRCIPVVVSETAGLADAVVDGESGLHVPPGDVDALAGAFRRLLTNRDLCAQMGVKARAQALSVGTVAACAERLLGHYCDLIDGSRAQPMSANGRFKGP